MEKNSVGKTWAKELSVLVEKLDVAYRSGNALVSDQQFDHLLTNLRRVDPDNDIFKGNKLLSLANGDYKEWLKDKLLPDVRLSDHSPFWDQGYNAMMITDTSFLRNPHYHEPTDTVDTLDLEFFSKVVEGLVKSLAKI